MKCFLSPDRRTSLTLGAIGLRLLLALLVLELHVAVMHDGTGQLVDAILLFLSEAQHVKGILWRST